MAQEVGFLARMKRGFKRVGELKEQWDEKRIASAEKRLQRQERYAKVYEAEARMYGAAAQREKAKQRYSQLRMGGFGQQKPFPIDMGMNKPQPQITKVVYRNAPKRKKARARYVTQPQKSFDDSLVEFMRR